MSPEVRCPHCGRAFAIPVEGESTSSVVDVLGPGFPPPDGSEADHEVAPVPDSAPEVASPPLRKDSPVIDDRSWDNDGATDLLRTPDPDQALSRFGWTPQEVAGVDSAPEEVPTIVLGTDHLSERLEAAARRWEASVQSEADRPPAESVAPAGAPVWLILLASYASALTLACGWLLWQTRSSSNGNREPLPETIQASETDRDGRRGSLSTRVAPLVALKEDHITEIERPMRVGDLEIKPESVQEESLWLERVNLTGQREAREGLPGTLVLRLELTNRSDDAVFAPLDEAFVRQTDAGPPLGFVEGRGGVRVYLYPLAETDEWELVGQRFSTLRPGERIETLVATDEDALRRLGDGPYLWRLRLRVGADANAVEDLGVRLTREQIR